jgi:soluble lytic murein transglycosylase-like protein
MRYLWLVAPAALLAQTAAPPSPQDGMRAAIEKQRAAVAAQRESVRKQAATAGVRLTPWDPAPMVASADCEPVPDTVVSPLLEQAAKAQQLEPKLLRAVIEQESGFHACAISSSGAKGLMQLMPAAIEDSKVGDPFDPKENIDAGAKFLKQFLDRYKGDLAQALGAYNAGPAAVDQAGGVPDFAETRDYVDAILRKLGISRTVQPSIPKPKPIEN